MSLRGWFLASACGLLVTGNAWAHSSVNTGEPGGTPVDNPTLQEILDELVVSGPGIDANSNAPIQTFEGTGTVVTFAVASYPDAQERFIFGIYDQDDPDALLALFDDRNDPTHPVSIAFNGDGSIAIEGGFSAGTHTGFDGPFGVWVKRRDFGSDDGPVFFFGENALNGGEQRVKVFQGDGTNTVQYPGLDPSLFLESEYLLAWEAGLNGDNDNGFDEFIVSLSVALPEPSALVLLGLTLAAAARSRRAVRI